MKYKKECKKCKKTYVSRAHHSLWCSKECGNLYRKDNKEEYKTWKGVKRNCGKCGVSFLPKAHNNVYCQYECRRNIAMSKTTRIMMNRFSVLKRDNFRCTYCGASPKDGVTLLHVDHILAKSKGGGDNLENLTTACEQCNLGKSNN